PPPLPPPSNPVPFDAKCSQCIKIDLILAIPFPSFRLSNRTCQRVLGHLESNLNQIAAFLNVSMTSKNFSTGAQYCTNSTIVICGEFSSKNTVKDNEALQESFRIVAEDVVIQLINALCPASSALTITATFAAETTDEEICFEMPPASGDCRPLPKPFPTCKCDMNKAITPYYTLPDISTEPGRRRGSKLYCFTIDKVPEQFYNRTNGCRSVERVEKIEIYADEFRRRNVTGVRIKPNGGPARWISPSWGPSGSDTFKVAPLQWDLTSAVGGSFCIELNIPLKVFCLEQSACFVSLFNELKNCCPTYAAAEEPEFDFNYIMP
ncbi:hypothetical protein Vafri_5983, partial [Volvox africanus]